MDWFVRALDHHTRVLTGTGNYSQVVIVLQGRLDPETLRPRLELFLRSNPVLSGRCRRDLLNLAPYWSVPRAATLPEPLLEVWSAAGRPATLEALADEVNRPLPGRPRIAFTLAQAGERSHLAMRFDHQILDAVSAERILFRLSGEEDPAAPLSLGDLSPHLDRWTDKFRSGRVVNRALLALRGTAPPAAPPLPAAAKRIPSRFVFRRFSEKETKEIVDKAADRVGYLMLLPFLLGVCVRSCHEFRRDLNLAEGDYVVPVTMNDRRTSAAGAVLFNHISFNFFRFESGAAADQEELWKQAAQQLYEQTRDRLAYHVAQAGYLMRILPAAWLGRLMRRPLFGRLGSFSFSLLAGQGYPSRFFLGIPVTNIYHMPRVPAPPGLGIYFTRYQSRLNLVLSYLEGIFPEVAAEALAEGIARQLRDEG